MKIDETTKSLQNIELDILKEFIRVCEILELNYFLIGGSLIGAVRHKGFIPWDDDIDVCMLRDEYEIFLREGQKYLDKKLFIQTYKTDENYSNCFAKIRNSETTFMEDSVKDVQMNHGIFIDIFPIDNLYSINKIKAKMIHYALYQNYFLNSENLFKKCFAYLSKIFYRNKTKLELCKKLEKIHTLANDKNKDKVVNYCGSWGVKKESHYKDDFSDYQLVDFENIKVKIPIGYDRILKDTYGDYMKLPPEEKRVSHHYTEVIDVNKSYINYFCL